MVTTDVDLADLADAAATAAAARHADLEVATSLPEAPVIVRGWEPGLRLVAENLVENAARHGRPGGLVRVTLLAAGNGAGEGALLHVDDDGPGVPEDERERIFAPFARVEGRDGQGSGLGLALVEQQVRHHGGRIEVTDSPLGGARFTVRFGAA